jgi:hypothetical protein
VFGFCSAATSKKWKNNFFLSISMLGFLESIFAKKIGKKLAF